MKYSSLIYCGIVLITINGCARPESKKVSNIPDKFIDPVNMDTTVRPGDDFFHYANGVWMKNNPIPDKETRWGSFNELREFNAQAVKGLLEEAAANTNATPGSIEQRVGDFFKSSMDSLAIEEAGAKPIIEDLNRIDKINDLKGIINEINHQQSTGLTSPFYDFYVYQDSKNANKNMPQLSQGGITLPDRDYYLVTNDRNNTIKEAYKKYIAALFKLTGLSEEQAAANFDAIWKTESILAKSQKSRVEMRDPIATYNKFSLEQFSQNTQPFNWVEILPALKVNGADSIIVDNPQFFIDEGKLIASTPIEDLKVYLKWNILKKSAPYLSKDFVDANFAFAQVLSGQKVMTPRWQRNFTLIDNTIGDLLGQLYVAKYFTPEAKQRMQDLVKNLSVTFAERIQDLDWMSEETKKKALEKLNAFTPKIGYTDKWETYDGLEINADDFYGNVKRADQWNYDYMVSQYGKPVDRTRWGMTPPTVNAYYNPVNNEIAFPAGILQFPFFAFEADDAINYGGIGAVIGHEMTHGFDDQGRQFAADGNLKDWWTSEDATKFKERADKVVDQYNKYTVLDTINVNGNLTLGENLADLGGLAIAYAAFKKTPQGQSNELIDGLTPDQRFFLSWAQVWRMNIRPETAAQFILVDPHSPADARTVGPIVNMDAWYKAFNIQEGDKLFVPEKDRIKVW
ncbi:M13 family metallopeptidase [Albibacterium bauzanense]|uniref:Putative endopeptidase n=1 Tax=Albibacterium bauzanense TaxID=653929 RepID=A0A4R1M4Y4_9SPHI|nr:M13 family metallopeptidase [Albibacterium bauzanense]TCK84793.1 putative endopeptidase [Albibacterium bauzanense]